MVDLRSEYVTRAAELLEKGLRTYGLPHCGPVYDGNLRHIVDPTIHDFRLLEVPQYVGDDAYMQQSRRILDLGCGPATMVYRALGFGHDAWGIDLDDDKLGLAHFRVDAEGYPSGWKRRVLKADATNLPFPDESYDVVSSWQVLEHIENLPQALFEAVRVTRRGGWLDLRAPDYRQSFDNHYAMAWPRFMPREQALRWARAMGRPEDGVGTFFYVTMPQVAVILEALGCRIASATLWQHVQGIKQPFSGRFGSDPIIFRSNSENVEELANELRRLESAGELPGIYRWPLEFVISAQRL